MPSLTAIPTTPPSELATTLSLAEVMRALGLDHAASILEPAMAKAIAHNDSPTTLLDQLMREQLRVQAEHRAQMALKRSWSPRPSGPVTCPTPPPSSSLRPRARAPTNGR